MTMTEVIDTNTRKVVAVLSDDSNEYCWGIRTGATSGMCGGCDGCLYLQCLHSGGYEMREVLEAT